MGRRLATVNAGLMTSHGLSLQMRIGVNTGEVLTFAAAEPGAALVAGDVVNVASRLQTSGRPRRRPGLGAHGARRQGL